MVYRVPNKAEENWKSKYLCKQGQYLCYDCNKPQHVKTFNGYLEPCRYCGCRTFWQ